MSAAGEDYKLNVTALTLRAHRQDFEAIAALSGR
jgi:hypothetical protein